MSELIGCGVKVIRPESTQFSMKGKRVLIIEDKGGIGDMLTLAVVVAQFKKIKECTTIVRCKGDSNGPRAELLRHCAGIDEVVTMADMSNLVFDCAIDVSEDCARGEMAEIPSVTSCRAELFCRALHLQLPDSLSPFINLSAVEVLNAVEVLESKGINCIDFKYVALGTRSAELYKDWKVEYWEQLRGLLKEHEIPYISFGDEVDETELGIVTTAALLRYASCVVSVDTLWLHLAGALGVPAIGMFGPSGAYSRIKPYPKAWGLQANLGCSPCWRNCIIPCQLDPHTLDKSYCMSEILPGEVFTAIKMAIAEEEE
jgi:hypothetical protein